jgi:hypothetical protein
MKTELSNVTYALWDCDVGLLKFLLTIDALVWSSMLIWPGASMNRPIYANMLAIGSEDAWTLFFLVLLFLKSYDLLTYKTPTLANSLITGLTALSHTLCVTLLLVAVYPPAVAVGGELALTLGALWIWVRPMFLKKGIENACRKPRILS